MQKNGRSYIRVEWKKVFPYRGSYVNSVTQKFAFYDSQSHFLYLIIFLYIIFAFECKFTKYSTAVFESDVIYERVLNTEFQSVQPQNSNFHPTETLFLGQLNILSVNSIIQDIQDYASSLINPLRELLLNKFMINEIDSRNF